MISLLLTMLVARRFQAVTVFLLSALATASAVAGPVALEVLDRTIVRNEVAVSTTNERSMSVTAYENPSDNTLSTHFNTVAGLLQLPGFDMVRAGELLAFGPVAAGGTGLTATTNRVVFRDRVCEHVTIVSGRCLAGAPEVIIGEDTARRRGIAAGQQATVQAARYDQTGRLAPDGEPTNLLVVGIYQPRDPDELYWASQGYFPRRSDGTRGEPLFVTVSTFDGVDHTVGFSSADSLAPEGLLTLDRLPVMQSEVGKIEEARGEVLAEYTVDTGMPELFDRISAGRETAHRLVPVIFIPLVGICWFVVFLAVAYGITARRYELGLVTLRGIRPSRRWWLATGETSIVILAGAPVGYLLGYAIVDTVARTRLGDGGVSLSLSALPYAVIAIGGALVVALLGQRRVVAEPVVHLLRGVPSRTEAWRAAAIELVLLALAALAVVQLRTSDGGLAGVGALAPGLVVVGVAVLAARAFIPLVRAVARWTLRRRLLGTALAAVQLARRPGGQRLFGLIAVSTGLITFAFAGAGAAAKGRTDQAAVAVGAPTVVSVDRTTVDALLAATRAADPDGAWAMAVVPLGRHDPKAPPVLAVDSGRLGTVATWRPEFGPTPEEAMQRLRPPLQPPVIVRAEQIGIDIAREANAGSPPVAVDLHFVSVATGQPAVATALVRPGRAVYRATATGCADGCRLTGLAVAGGNEAGDPAAAVKLNLYGLRRYNPDADAAPVADLIRADRWLASSTVTIREDGSSLRIETNPSAFGPSDLSLIRTEVGLPLPVVATRATSADAKVTGLDSRPVPVSLRFKADILPRLGGDGALVDLEQLAHVSLTAAARRDAEVWLGAAAPPDALDRLRRQGLVVYPATSVSEQRDQLERQGPALALQFYLVVAVLAAALTVGGMGLVAAVNRHRQAADLRALRHQGLGRRYVRRAASWGNLSIVVGGAVAGLGAGAAAWLLTRDRMPIVIEKVAALPPPAWPPLSAVAIPWAVATGALLMVSLFAAWSLRRTANQPGV